MVMQKLKCLFFALLLLFTISCEKDYDEDFNTIEVRLTTENNVAPEGNAYVFYLGKNKNLPEVLDVMFDFESGDRYLPFFVFEEWQGEYYKKFYPVSEYGDENAGTLHRNNKYSYAMFYVEKFSRKYGTPQPGDVFLILVVPYKKWNAPAFVIATLDKNSVVKAIYTNTTTANEMLVEWDIKGGKDLYPGSEIIKVTH